MTEKYFNAIYDVIELADLLGYDRKQINRKQALEGNSLKIKNERYDIYVDITTSDNDINYHLSTNRMTSNGLENEIRNIKDVKSLGAVETYLTRLNAFNYSTPLDDDHVSHEHRIVI